jgi:hypothetical protein
MKLIMGVIEWHQQHPGQRNVKTPIELEYIQRYALPDEEWPFDLFGDKPERVIDQYDDLLTVSAIETVMLSTIPEALIAALGGKIYSAYGDAADVLQIISGVAPDDATAQRVYDEVVAGMQTDDDAEEDEDSGYVVIETPEALQGEYSRFEIERQDRTLTFTTFLLECERQIGDYLRSHGFTNLRRELRQINNGEEVE